ncbi:hypothetical protein [Brasilonema sp. UFV-L1]|uniref:hypothetical protein n=1 Tax=Brasilonema sp. UFV-L1 TaxID=2234130 RepID=UPI00145CACB2|nr:hypothetical protein [Brasilonema sp. UFV-L1]NMG11803.1 hypothetical protein [Brasilonema sp. UFV-L1]
MAVARKSNVSATGSQSRTAAKSGRKSGSAHQKKASTEPEKTPQTKQLSTPKVTLPASSTPVSTQKPRHSSKKSVSFQQLTKEASSTNKHTTTSVSELGKQKASAVPMMPSAESVPFWLLRLCTLHRYSSIVAFALVAVTLVVYGWTVYSQQLWSQAYRKLQNLQRHERQLMTTNEVLKNKMAQEVERTPGKFVSPSPDRMIFWEPAPIEPNSVPPTAPNSERQLQTPNPVGY